MYIKHVALTHFPFDNTLESTELFTTSAQSEAEVRLNHLLKLRGIGLLTGEPGQAAVKPLCIDALPMACIRAYIESSIYL